MSDGAKHIVRNVFLMFGKIIAGGIISLAILSVIAFFYNFTGIHVTSKSGATDYVWQSRQNINNLNEGFAMVKMDKNGLNNTFVPENVDILLMGSSHMEAYQVAQNKNTGALLNSLLPDKSTYNIGVSGHTLYRIADNIEAAAQEFEPAEYIIIETSSVNLDMEQMQKVLDGNAERIKSHDSGILYYLQKIPAFKPLYNQLENWIKQSERNSNDDEGAVSEEISLANGYEELALRFLSVFADVGRHHDVEIVIFYAPSEFIDADGNVTYPTQKVYVDAFAGICKSVGIQFVDMTDAFQSVFDNERKLCHGFSNTAVGTGHLNEYGHRAIAERLADYVRNNEV